MLEQIFNAIDFMVVGQTALGATLFLASAGFIALAFWGVSRLLGRARIESRVVPSLNRIDGYLATGALYPTGLKLRGKWTRRSVFAAVYTVLLASAVFTPPVIGFMVCATGMVLGLGLFRSFERERRAERDGADMGQPLIDPIHVRPESLIGFALTAWFLATALYRLNEISPVLNGSGTLAILTPVLFAWNEIIQTLIPGDAGHVLGFDRFVSERATGSGAAGYMIAIRAVMELTALIVILRTAFALKDLATGRQNLDVDEFIESESTDQINLAFDALEDRALKNRRGAQLRVIHIASGLRKDQLIQQVEHRLRAADILLKVAQNFRDPGSAMTAAQTYRQCISQLNRNDNPITWAQTHVRMAEAIKTASNLTGDLSFLEEAIEALQNAGKVLNEESAPEEWAAIHDELGEIYQTAAEVDPRRLRDAIHALRTGLQLRKRGGLAPDRARTQVRLAECLVDAGQLNRDQAPVREAIAICRDAQEVHARAGDKQAWSEVRLVLGRARHLLARQTGDASRLQDADAELLEAIKETPRSQRPAQWAALQHLRGCVMRSLAASTSDPDKIGDAIEAFKAALEVRTRSAMAPEWAETQAQLGDSLKMLGEYRKSADAFAGAAEAYRKALSVMNQNDPSQRRPVIVYNLGLCLSAHGRLAETPPLMDEAIEALEEAVRLTNPEQAPGPWSAANHALGIALQAKGKMENNVDALIQAHQAYVEALSVRLVNKMPGAHATTQAKIAETYLALYPLRKDTQLLEKALEAFMIAKEAFEAAGDRNRTARMVEQIRRIRAVHRGPAKPAQPQISFGESNGEDEDYAQAG